MLARPKFEKEQARIEKKMQEGKVYVQPKLDGFRCLASRDGLWTRNLRVINTCDHISEALADYFKANPNVVLDGELYNHDYRDDFGKIQSLITKGSVDLIDRLDTREKIQFHVYDCIMPSPFSERLAHLADSLSFSHPLELVETSKVSSVEDILAKHNQYRQLGYEGTMIRVSDLGYDQNKRSSQLVKMKDFSDEEFEIIGVKEGKGQWKGAAKSVLCKDTNGNIFDAGCSGTYEYLSMVLKNVEKFVGGKVTVAYQQKFPSGVPRFPVAKKFFTK